MKTHSKGFVATLAVLFFALALGAFLVLLIDLGRAYVVRTELRSVADAASLAALNAYTGYECTGTAQQCADPTWVQQQRVQAAYTAAQDAANRNPVMGIGAINLDSAQGIILGSYDESRNPTFQPENASDPVNPINAVRVDAKLGFHGNPQFRAIFGALVGGTSISLLEGTAIASGTVSVHPYDVVLVLDRSGSMNNASKFVLSKAAAVSFVDYLSRHQGDRTGDVRDRIAVVDFARSYRTASVLSSDFSSVKNRISSVQTNVDVTPHTRGGTTMEVAFARAFTLLQWKTRDNYEFPSRTPRKRMIVFLTDGMPWGTYVASNTSTNCPTMGQLGTPDEMTSSSWGVGWTNPSCESCCDDERTYDGNEYTLCEWRTLRQINLGNKPGSGDTGIKIYAIAVTEDASQINCPFIQQLNRNGGKSWCLVDSRPDPKRIFLEIANDMKQQRLVE